MVGDQISGGPRIVLLSCAGAPFSAEILQAIQRERPECLKRIVATVLSLPKVSPLVALPLGERWRKLFREKGGGALAKEVWTAVRYRINGVWQGLEKHLDQGRRRLSSDVATYRRIDEFCVAHGIPIHATRDVNAAETLTLLRSLAPDLIVMATFNHILRLPAIQIAKIATLNIHPSMLPEGRGPDPINEALKLGVKQTGVTIHFVDEGIDTGDILTQQSFQMPDGVTEKQLRAGLAQIAATLLIESLDRLSKDGRLSGRPQQVEGFATEWALGRV